MRSGSNNIYSDDGNSIFRIYFTMRGKLVKRQPERRKGKKKKRKARQNPINKGKTTWVKKRRKER